MKKLYTILICLAIIIPLGAIAMTSQEAQSLFDYQNLAAAWKDQGDNVSTKVITTDKTICTIASIMGSKTVATSGTTSVSIPIAISASISCIPFTK